jgi:hypothetical protein
MMPQVKEDESREQRIALEVVVDAYDTEEVRLGWYYYLEKKLDCPFQATWITKGQSSAKGQSVEVIGMAEEEECARDMLVEIRYREGEVEDIFSVPLTHIEPLQVDQKTEEAIADWHYWVDRGYKF